MVGDYISSSFLARVGGDTPVSVFAVGLGAPRKRCALSLLASCDEPIDAARAGAPAGLEATQSSSPPELATASPAPSGAQLSAR
jgi:hypothetical protein